MCSLLPILPAHNSPLTLQLVYPAAYSTTPLDIICPNLISYPLQIENSKICSILPFSFFINDNSLLPFAQSRSVRLILDSSSTSHFWTNLITFKMYLASDFSWLLLCFYPGPSHLHCFYGWFLLAATLTCLWSVLISLRDLADKTRSRLFSEPFTASLFFLKSKSKVFTLAHEAFHNLFSIPPAFSDFIFYYFLPPWLSCFFSNTEDTICLRTFALTETLCRYLMR